MKVTMEELREIFGDRMPKTEREGLGLFFRQ
jgi:hypothetical protein